MPNVGHVMWISEDTMMTWGYPYRDVDIWGYHDEDTMMKWRYLFMNGPPPCPHAPRWSSCLHVLRWSSCLHVLRWSSCLHVLRWSSCPQAPRCPHVYMYWDGPHVHMHRDGPRVCMYWDGPHVHMHRDGPRVCMYWDGPHVHRHRDGPHVYRHSDDLHILIHLFVLGIIMAIISNLEAENIFKLPPKGRNTEIQESPWDSRISLRFKNLPEIQESPWDSRISLRFKNLPEIQESPWDSRISLRFKNLPEIHESPWDSRISLRFKNLPEIQESQDVLLPGMFSPFVCLSICLFNFFCLCEGWLCTSTTEWWWISVSVLPKGNSDMWNYWPSSRQRKWAFHLLTECHVFCFPFLNDFKFILSLWLMLVPQHSIAKN